VKKVNDQVNCFEVDAFKYAKETGKYRYLGEIEMINYVELSERIKENIEMIRKITEKKRKCQSEYENKASNVNEI
jgi:predicted nucleic acid-binding Zn finger protein